MRSSKFHPYYPHSSSFTSPTKKMLVVIFRSNTSSCTNTTTSRIYGAPGGGGGGVGLFIPVTPCPLYCFYWRLSKVPSPRSPNFLLLFETYTHTHTCTHTFIHTHTYIRTYVTIPVRIFHSSAFLFFLNPTVVILGREQGCTSESVASFLWCVYYYGNGREVWGGNT